MSNYYLANDGGFLTEDELMHYGVVGMKWGVRRARNKGTSYSYKSRATKKYEKKAEKAKERGDSVKSEKFKKYAQKSAKLDKGMEDTARNMSVGRTAAATILNGPFSTKTYAAMRGAGYNKGTSAASAAVINYLAGPFGASTVRDLYIRDQLH